MPVINILLKMPDGCSVFALSYNKRRLSADGTAIAVPSPARFARGRRLKRTHSTELSKLTVKPITQRSLPRRKRRGVNGLCAEPLAKSRFYRLAAVPLFIFS